MLKYCLSLFFLIAIIHPALCYHPEPSYNQPVSHYHPSEVGISLYGSLLYMQLVESNLSYATSSEDPIASNPVLNGQRLLPHLGWHPGIKAALELKTADAEWCVGSSWMRLIGKNNITSSAPEGGILFMPNSVAIEGPSCCLKASCNWGATLNQFNCYLSRSYLICPSIVASFIFGLVDTWIDQSYQVSYDQVTNSSGYQGNTKTLSEFNTNGIGPFIGFDSSLIIGEGFRLFGNGSFAIEYSWNNTKKNITNPNLANSLNENNIVSKLKQNTRNILPNSQLAIGFAWGSPVHKQDWYLDFAVSYELWNYWNQNTNFIYTDSLDRGSFVQGGNLNLHGVNFTASFDF